MVSAGRRRRGDIDFVQVNSSLAEPEAELRLLRGAADSGTAVTVNWPFAEGAMFRRVKGTALPDWRRKMSGHFASLEIP